MRRLASVAIVLAGAACSLTSDLDGLHDPHPTAPDAGSEASSSPPLPPPTSGAPGTPDAAPAPGTFVWELHGSMNPDAIKQPLGLAATSDDRVVLALGFLSLSGFEDGTLTGPAGAIYATKPTLPTFDLHAHVPTGGIGASAVDSAGDIYVGGALSDASTTIGAVTLTNSFAPQPVAFLAKFSGKTGTALWATSFDQPGRTGGATSLSAVSSIATRGTDIAAGITFNSSVRVKLAGGSFNQVVASDYDALVVSIDGATGDALWGQKIGGNGPQSLFQVAIDEARHTFVVGAADRGNITVSDVSVASNDSPSPAPYLLRFSRDVPYSADFVKVLDIGPLGNAGAQTAVAITEDNDVVTCGNFTGQIGPNALASHGLFDVFVARWSNDGEPRWLKTFGGGADEQCPAIATAGNRVTIALNHKSSGVRIGDHTLADPESAGAQAGAVVTLEQDGSYRWSTDVLAPTSWIASVVGAPNGDVVYAGEFLGAADLGNGSVTNNYEGGTGATVFAARRTP